MKTIIAFSITVIMLCLAGCSSVKDTPGSKSPEGTWILKSMKGNPVALSSMKDVTLVFAAAESKISGFGGCNSYFGNYTTDNGALNISGLGSTKMACDDMGSESDYFSLLQKADKYTITQNVLSLYSSGSVILVFEKKP
jgi:heat shock protein HslJ